MSHLFICLFLLAFRSTGIYPLNRNWASMPENVSKLAVDQRSPPSCPKLAKLAKLAELIGKYSVEDKVKEMNYNGFIDLPTQTRKLAFSEAKLRDAEGLDTRTVLSKKQRNVASNKKSVAKRSRTTFENQADARILNTDDRLAALTDYLSKKKVKKDSKERKRQ